MDIPILSYWAEASTEMEAFFGTSSPSPSLPGTAPVPDSTLPTERQDVENFPKAYQWLLKDYFPAYPYPTPEEVALPNPAKSTWLLVNFNKFDNITPFQIQCLELLYK
ncbi:hypothetical protein TWF173_003167 [Orbilia oligospora]|nr:hypothetical protein TWF173_003167 [Orbilia oligospora]